MKSPLAFLGRNGQTFEGPAADGSANNQALVRTAAKQIGFLALTASRALVSDASGGLAASSVTATQLGYVAGVTSSIQAQLDAKAPLASPVLTGDPTAPTQSPGTNNTRIATTAYCDAAIAALGTITATPTNNAIVKANGSGKIDLGWLLTGSGNGLDADRLDGKEAAEFALLTGATYSGVVNVAASGSPTGFTPVAGTVMSLSSISGTGSNCWLHLVSGNAGFSGIYFGDPDSTTMGSINYGNSGDIMTMRAGGGNRLTLTSAAVSVLGNTFAIRTAKTPASAAATGVLGDICWDTDYIYLCTATNTWRRIAHATW